MVSWAVAIYMGLGGLLLGMAAVTVDHDGWKALWITPNLSPERAKLTMASMTFTLGLCVSAFLREPNWLILPGLAVAVVALLRAVHNWRIVRRRLPGKS
jgi:hypothetical protein